MRERLNTLMGAALALGIVVLLLNPGGEGEKPLSRPTSVDRGEDGLAALARWLESGGVPVVSLRERYDTLPPQTGGDLLITAIPHHSAIESGEVEALQQWVAAGNSLLVLAALSDWPDWAQQGLTGEIWTLPRALGIEPEPHQPASGPEDPETLERSAFTLRPPAGATLLEGIGAVSAHWLTSEHPFWRLDTADERPRRFLVLLRDRFGEPALWQLRMGRGRVWFSRHAELFDNGTLGEADNAALALRLVNGALGPGGRVLFDDRHQGLSTLYDPDAFFSDPRLHNTLWFLLALWLVYLLGHSNRLLPPRSGRGPVTPARELESVAGFLARRTTKAAAAQRLLHHFHNDLRDALHLPRNGEPLWETLGRHARVDRERLQRLRQLSDRAARGRPVDLNEMTRVMKQIKGSLQ